MEFSIYRRIKITEGKWRYSRVHSGAGKIKEEDKATPPYYLLHTSMGKQVWTRLDAQTLADAKLEAPHLSTIIRAKASGVAASDLKGSENRKTIREAADEFLAAHLTLSTPRRTVAAYRMTIERFVTFAAENKISFVDGINDAAMRAMVRLYKQTLEREGYSLRTVRNYFERLASLLKENGYHQILKLASLQKPEERRVEAYGREELKRLFGYLETQVQTGETEAIREKATDNIERYRFFLTSSLREQEVQFLTTADVNFKRGVVTVRAKADADFTVKNHQSRIVPIPTATVEMLKRRSERITGRWLFPNGGGKTEGHFLRKLKQIALEAGLNCGYCRTKVTKGDYENKHEVEVSCKDHPTCEQWTLHRFRKTCAIRWMEDGGASLKKIQTWLGHKSLRTTEIYLGSGVFEESDRAAIDSAHGD